MKQRAQEIASLQEQLAEASSQLEGMELDIRKFLANQQQLAELTAAQEAKNKQLEDEYRVKKRTMDLLPNAEENIVKLEGLVGSSSDRLVKLGNKWEEHRRPLVDEYRSLRETQSSRMVCVCTCVCVCVCVRACMRACMLCLRSGHRFTLLTEPRCHFRGELAVVQV